MSEAFIHIRHDGRDYQVSGQTSCSFGHKIKNPQRKDIDGIFADWEWDGTTLRVRNDRYGFYPIFFYAAKNEVAVSTSIVKLIELGAPTNLDDAGLAALLRFGYFIGDDTPFKAIRAFPPNTNFEWRVDYLQNEGRLPAVKPQTMERNAAIDDYISLFQASMKRRLPSQEYLAVPLSGGRDSRHIVLELCRQGAPPNICLTADFFPIVKIKNEVEIASMFCREVGVPHLTLGQTDTMLNTELRKNLTVNFSGFDHNWYLVISDYLRQFPSCSAYDGIAGDILSAGDYVSEKRVEWAEKGQTDKLAEDLTVVLKEDLIDRLLKPELAKRFSKEAAFSRFKEEFSKHANAQNAVGTFHLYNRTRRTIAPSPYGLLNHVPEVFSPFLDNDLHDFLASLPISMYIDHNFHTDTIKRAYPKYAHIPYSAYMNVSGDHIQANHRRFSLDVMNYLINSGYSRWLRPSYVVPRLIKCVVTPSYSSTVEWLGLVAIFFAQFDRVVKGAAQYR